MTWNLQEWLKRSQEEAAAAFAAGHATVGGPFEGMAFPGYAQAYVRAAGAVLTAANAKQELDILARPCVYLQRHAAELHIKNLRDIAGEILSRKAGEEYEPPRFTHGLVALLAAAKLNIAAVGDGWAVPQDLELLVNELVAFEGPDETVLRYERTRKNVPSFPERKNAPVRYWQRRLEAIDESLTVRDDFATRAPETYSMFEAIVYELYLLSIDDEP
jgi:hypothetical protein